MLFSASVALLAATFISLLFASTRRIAVYTVTALSALFPLVATVIFAIGLAAATYFYFHKGVSK